PSERSADVQNLLDQNWDLDANRQNALDMARAEAEADPQNALAWFNVGSNLVYFQRYNEAAAAYDQARSLDLPQRMLRYQFGPFLAYFHSGRNDDLMALVDYALSVTDNSEEALLWQGWGRYRQQDIQGALASFQKALEYHPNYGDALYAIGYIQQN
ncbi:MAG: tetratricopeptide repeat protein, partial [Anaerolineaceae bacterium]|nr:tetratricopeptide repeat protein [Anaerolineaceae bacterium]